MSLRLYLFADGEERSLFTRQRKAQKEIREVITQQILSATKGPRLDAFLPETYPWCFVISAAVRKRHLSYVGAFMILPGEEGLAVIYAEVSHSWLTKNLQEEHPVTFWASRILHSISKEDMTNNNWQSLWQWIRALKRAYSPFWESFALTPAWRFKTQSQVLLREGTQDDFRIRSSDGAELMPWKNWPDCIQQEASIWIWRQSRHSNILDSQRIPLRGAEAISPDASF